jgi:uncharacterized membrane protein YuzA (DUF378 family)
MIDFLRNFLTINTVRAAGILNGVDAPTEASDVADMVTRIYNIVVGMAGVVAFAAILYSAALFFTANGDQAKISKARMSLTLALTGVGLIFISRFAIIAFIKLFGGGVV